MRKSKYAEIGKSGTQEQLRDAFGRVADSAGLFWESAQKKENALVEGAVQAFLEGHRESVNTVLSNPAILTKDQYKDFAFTVLGEIAARSGDKLNDMNLALAGVAEGDRQKVLDGALYRETRFSGGTESFIDLLLQAGADPNAEIDSQKAGYILVSAVYNDKPESFIKLLHDHGARFEDALQLMRLGNFHPEYIRRMEAYQEKFDVKPAAAESAAEVQSEILLRMDRMEQRMEEIFAVVSRMASLIEGAAAPQPAAAEEPRQGKPAKGYDHFKPL